jgi:transposase
LEVVIEPTGPAWLPVAVFFGGRGHTVYRVSSQKAADLRRFLHRHAKSNSIDADTLARLPLVDPAGLHPVELPSAARAGLDRRVRACDRLTQAIATHKKRIRDLAAQLVPTIQAALGADLGRADLAVLERYGDPRAMVAAGRTRLARPITRASNGHLDAHRADAYLACARAALALDANDPAVAFSDLADELASEIRLLRAAETELARHQSAREAHYHRVDPEQLARSLPGIATVGGPLVVAALGRPGRFATGAQVRAYTGLTPRASQTGDTDRKGQPMSKAGSARLRTLLLRAADTARTQDPQLAKLYYTQMVDRGATHLKALCVVAAHLAERIWVVLGRGRPYVVCDPTAGRSALPRPSSSSPSTSPSPTRCAASVAARRWGRPLTKSSQDMQVALKAQRGDPPQRPSLPPPPNRSSDPRTGLDTPTALGNQSRTTIWSRPGSAAG